MQRFVSKERANPPQEHAPQWDNKRPRPPIRDIRMIIGGIVIRSAKKASKTYLKMVQNFQLTGSVPKMA